MFFTMGDGEGEVKQGFLEEDLGDSTVYFALRCCLLLEFGDVI